MSSTMRLFINDNRISTAVPTKNGGIFQVYPVKKQFLNEVSWRQHWDEAMKPKIILKITHDETEDAVLPVKKQTLDAIHSSIDAYHATRSKTATPAPLPDVRPSRSKTTGPAFESPPVKPTSLDDWKITAKDNFTHTLPAGTYYIGDLCYVLGDDIYEKIFGASDYDSGIYEEKGTGRVFAVANTAYGDGMYPSSDGREFAVDAGIIGICSQDLMTKNDGGGHVYTFEGPVACHFKVGRFTFVWKSGWNSNSLVIDTTGDDDAY